MPGLQDKITFLVADERKEVCAEISNLIKDSFENSIIYVAQDGSEAIKKLKNAPPKLFICGMEQGTQLPFADLIRAIELDSSLSRFPIAVLSDIVDTEPKFKEDIAKGRLKFISMPVQKDEFFQIMSSMLKMEKMDRNTFVTLNLGAGTILFEENQPADRAFLLKKGRLEAFRNVNGKRVGLGFILPGEFVGEMAHITGEPRSANVVCIEEAELVEIPLGTLDLLIFSKPTWTKALLKTLCRRLQDANKKQI